MTHGFPFAGAVARVPSARKKYAIRRMPGRGLGVRRAAAEPLWEHRGEPRRSSVHECFYCASLITSLHDFGTSAAEQAKFAISRMHVS